MTRPHVTILGMPGSGKSTLAECLAERSGLPHRDGDEVLVTRRMASAATVAADEGVDALHALERSIARDMLADDEPAIVTPAASALDDAATMALVRRRSWLVVVLDAETTLLAARRDRSGGRRPMSVAELESRWTARRPAAVAVADVVLDADQPLDVLTERVAATIRAC